MSIPVVRALLGVFLCASISEACLFQGRLFRSRCAPSYNDGTVPPILQPKAVSKIQIKYLTDWDVAASKDRTQTAYDKDERYGFHDYEVEGGKNSQNVDYSVKIDAHVYDADSTTVAYLFLIEVTEAMKAPKVTAKHKPKHFKLDYKTRIIKGIRIQTLDDYSIFRFDVGENVENDGKTWETVVFAGDSDGAMVICEKTAVFTMRYEKEKKGKN